MFELLTKCRVSLLAALFLCTISGAAVVEGADDSRCERPAQVSIVMTSSYCLMYNNVIRGIYADYPWLKKKALIRVFPLDTQDADDLPGLARSEIIFLYVHNPGPLEKFMPSVLPALDGGASVYALGTSAAEEAYREKGIKFHKQVLRYFAASGAENARNMILSRIREDLGLAVTCDEPMEQPKQGIYERHSGKIYESYEQYKSNYHGLNEGNPWIGVVFWRSNLITGQLQVLDAMLEAIERRGFNVLPIFGYPDANAVETFFLDGNGVSRVDFVVAQSLWHGVKPDEMRLLMSRVGVPVLNAIQLSMSEQQWRQSPVGIDIWRRTTSIAIPEMMGQIQPTVTGAKADSVDPGTGVQFSVLKPVHERVERLAERVNSWYLLQRKPNREKNVAVIYYSYPPGKENIGASYLNVLPQSLVRIMNRMKAEGYELGPKTVEPDSLFEEIMAWGRNVGNYAQGEVENLVASGKPVMVPLEEYKNWFSELSPKIQQEVNASWGLVDTSSIMVWRDKKKNGYLIIPAVRYGNVLLTPQPGRGWEEDAGKMYHDVSLPPHHQYIAFYLYLKKSFHADAVIHLGTHGTYEWLSGREAGLGDDDPPEALIQDIPSIYPYIVDDVGEGLQAKRRGAATIIDHMTPPFDKSGLNPELRELKDLMSEHDAALGKSPTLAAAKIGQINRIAVKTGVVMDLGLDSIATAGDIHDLEHYLKEIAEKQSPFGLHTFGLSPEPDYQETTARAMASVDTKLSESEREKLVADFKDRIKRSGPAELDALIAALNGKYIEATKGGDPLRNPNSLPTGKNFYAFDPSKIPSKAIYELGKKLAKELLDSYKEENGEYPDKLSFNLWSTECIRHEGVQEAQILSLLGIRPRWDARGVVTGMEVIPRRVLGRPRVDVIIVPSGLYRDVFGNLMHHLDSAVELAGQQDEQDNFVRKHILATRSMLMKKGVDAELANRLASVRMFSVPTGSYGTGVENVVTASGTWEDESEVISVYFNRMSHLYGQGFHGEKPEESIDALKGLQGFSIDLFKGALSGTKVAVHSRSSNVYAALDNDDFYQYLGATAMAVRAVDGTTPKVYVTNLTDPGSARQETLEKFMGREMRTRYLNPKWITEMMDEGYAGARFIKRVVNHLWGWQVTVPEAVGDEKWQEMYETYVEDRYELDIEQLFRDADNLWAYQNILARMLEVVRKEYWDADQQVVETLVEKYMETVEEVGLACSGNICDNPKLVDFVAERMEQIPALAARASDYQDALEQTQVAHRELASVPDPARQVASESSAGNASYQPMHNVEGYELEQQQQEQPRELAVKNLPLGLIVLLLAFVAGWLLLSRRKR